MLKPRRRSVGQAITVVLLHRESRNNAWPRHRLVSQRRHWENLAPSGPVRVARAWPTFRRIAARFKDGLSRAGGGPRRDRLSRYCAFCTPREKWQA